MVTLGIVGILYGAFVSWVQPDMKKLIAYSSVAHLGFVVVGIFSMSAEGMQGAVIQMINHGLSTGMLFLVVGMIYETAPHADDCGIWRRGECHAALCGDVCNRNACQRRLAGLEWIRRRIPDPARHIQIVGTPFMDVRLNRRNGCYFCRRVFARHVQARVFRTGHESQKQRIERLVVSGDGTARHHCCIHRVDWILSFHVSRQKRIDDDCNQQLS